MQTLSIKIDYVKCKKCDDYTCVDCCAMAVLNIEDNVPVIVDMDACTLCGICEDLCQKKAITIDRG